MNKYIVSGIVLFAFLYTSAYCLSYKSEAKGDDNNIERKNASWTIQLGFNYSHIIREKVDFNTGIKIGINRIYLVGEHHSFNFAPSISISNFCLANKTIKPRIWDEFDVFVADYNFELIDFQLPILYGLSFSVYEKANIKMIIGPILNFNMNSKMSQSINDYFVLDYLPVDERGDYEFDYSVQGKMDGQAYESNLVYLFFGLNLEFSRSIFGLHFIYRPLKRLNNVFVNEDLLIISTVYGIKL